MAKTFKSGLLSGKFLVILKNGNRPLKAFLSELQKYKGLLNTIRVAASANKIAEISSAFGYKFSGNELKAVSKENIAGVKIKSQNTSPFYSFGELGIDPNKKI